MTLNISKILLVGFLVAAGRAFAESSPPCPDESTSSGVSQAIKVLLVEGIDGKRIALNGITLKATAINDQISGTWFQNKVHVEFETPNGTKGGVMIYVTGLSDTCAILSAR